MFSRLRSQWRAHPKSRITADDTFDYEVILDHFWENLAHGLNPDGAEIPFYTISGEWPTAESVKAAVLKHPIAQTAAVDLAITYYRCHTPDELPERCDIFDVEKAADKFANALGLKKHDPERNPPPSTVISLDQVRAERSPPPSKSKR